MGSSMLGRTTFLIALVYCFCSCRAYPSIFVARYQQTCTEHPATSFGRVHGHTKIPDQTVVFSLKSASSSKGVVQEKGVTTVCPGQRYKLDLAFGAPSKRNFLLTVTQGTFIVPQNDCDAWCPNRVCSVAPVPQSSAVYVVPCSAAPGTKVTIKITSGNGRIPTPGSTLRSATMSLVVGSSCGKCSSSNSLSSRAAAVERAVEPPGR